jgi:glycosyltransferase involved in cell wall biosynthesis
MVPRVLAVSRFARGWPPAADLREALRTSGWSVLEVAKRDRPLGILAELFAAIVIGRTRYDVAYVDVFSGRAFMWALWSVLLLRLARKPYVLSLQGGGLAAFARRRRRRIAWLLSGASSVTAPSKSQADGLRFAWPDIAVVPNMIDLGKYPFRLRSPAKASLLWLRAFHRIYDPVMAVRCIALLKERHPTVSLLMVGAFKDESIDECRREIALHGIEDRVRIREACRKDEVPSLLSEADIFLNTTTLESFGVSVVEAQAAGLCVVTTDAGAASEIVVDGENGLVVPAGDHAAMAEAVARIIEKPDLAARLSRGGRSSAERYDARAVTTAWADLLAAGVSSATRRRLRGAG